MLIEELQDFTYEAYRKFLKLLKQRYKIVPFCEVSKKEDSFLILRHDVDASLDAALKLAKMENSLGVRATYFVLFSHKLYNLLQKDDLNVLRKIAEFGHEIGLHYDVAAHEAYGRDLKKTLENEIILLEHLLDKRISSIACHNVSIMSGEDPFRNARNYINVYDPELCKNYVSDSCRAWYLEHLAQLLAFKYEKVQLLIHPFLWTEDVCERDSVLERFFQKVEDKNRAYLHDWLELWHRSPKVKKYDELAKK